MATRKINGAFGLNGRVYRAGQEDELYADATDAGKNLTNPGYQSVLTGDWSGATDEANSTETDYASMTKDELQKLADEREITVEGSGANGNVVKDDLIAALSAG